MNIMNLKNVRKRIALFAILLMTTTSALASVGKLAEFLVSDSGVVEMLSRRAVDQEVIPSVKSYVRNALLAIGTNKQKPSAENLVKAIEKMRINKAKYPEDYAKKEALLSLLDKNAKEVSEQDLKDAINNLIYLANRRGNKTKAMISCAQCVNEQLANNGFIYTFDKITDTKIGSIINTIPKDPRSRLVNVIKPGLKKIGGTKSYMGLVEPSEDKALSLFIKVLEKGTEKQKRLAKAVLNVSKDSSGNVLLLNRKNKHKLWKLFVEDMNDDVMDGWIDILEKTSTKAESGSSYKQAFYDTLDEIAGENDELKKHSDFIKRNDCFFL